MVLCCYRLSPQVRENILFATLHAAALGSGALMVVAQQVKQAMSKKKHDAFLKRLPELAGLARRGRQRDDDVPQHEGSRLAFVGLALWKGQHVGRAVLTAVSAI